MAMRPEDRPKIIALLVLIVVLFGYFFASVLPRLMSNGKPSTSPPAQTTASAPAATTPAAAPAAPAPTASASPAQPQQVASTGQIPAELQDTQGPMTPVNRNPFLAPEGLPGDHSQAPRPANTSPAPPAPPNPGQATRPPANMGRPLPPLAPGTLGTRSMAQESNPGLPTINGPKDEMFQLKGVVRGRPPVAVFKVGDSVVSVERADMLPNGMVVAGISGDGVILQSGKRLYSQEVGGPLRPVLRIMATGTSKRKPPVHVAEWPSAPDSASSVPAGETDRTAESGSSSRDRTVELASNERRDGSDSRRISDNTESGAPVRVPTVSHLGSNTPAAPVRPHRQREKTTPTVKEQGLHHQDEEQKTVQRKTVRRHKVSVRRTRRGRHHRYIIRHGHRLYWCWRHHRFHRWPVAAPRPGR